MIEYSFNLLSLVAVCKIIFSACVGFLIGSERKRHEKVGGSRTLALVCMSATLLAILSLNLEGKHTFDFVRLLAYSMTGIGFIGSGIILKNKNQIEGVTSASTLFIIMPVGFMIGLGEYLLTIVTALIIFVLLEIKYLPKRKYRKRKIKKVKDA